MLDLFIIVASVGVFIAVVVGVWSYLHHPERRPDR